VSRSSCLNKAEILSSDGTSICLLKLVEYNVEVELYECGAVDEAKVAMSGKLPGWSPR